MFKNLVPKLRLSGLLVSAIVMVLTGCSSNDDNNCAFSNSCFLQSHHSGEADSADELLASTNDGANAGSNPSIALSVPGIGEIPGTEDVPFDVGEILSGFGGAAYIEVLEALSSGDIDRLLEALGRPADSDLLNLKDHLASLEYDGFADFPQYPNGLPDLNDLR